MARLGINTMVWSGGFDERQFELFGKIREMGYEVVELPVFDFDAVDGPKVRRAVSGAGLLLTVSSAMPAGLSVVNADSAVRAATRRWLENAVRKVAEMGGSILAGPMYIPVGELPGRRRTPAEWNRAVEEYRALAQTIGDSGVRLALEPLNRFETYFLNTAADAGALCEQIGSDAIGVLFDTFHANIEEDDVAVALCALGTRLIHVHLSENHRGVPGTGHVPFHRVAGALRELGYSGHMVVESFASSIPELARATAMWRDYASSPDAFAEQAIGNLRVYFAGDN